MLPFQGGAKASSGSGFSDLTPRRQPLFIRTRQRQTPRGSDGRYEPAAHQHNPNRTLASTTTTAFQQQQSFQPHPPPQHAAIQTQQNQAFIQPAQYQPQQQQQQRQQQHQWSWQQQPQYQQHQQPQQQQQQQHYQQQQQQQDDGVFRFGAGGHQSGNQGLGPAKSTLWSWSKAMWSDPKQWPHVYEGCQDRIGEDPRAMAPRTDLHTCTLVPRIGKRKTVTVSTTVKKGDCLWGISRHLTGTGTNWKDIVNENRHYFKKARFDSPIDDDLFIIQPGWKLKMPVTAPPPPED
ncbi:hypothetical protein CLOM_g24566 [Closterium sp. NIES-68]|nr:hypothetical protein CLOM_g24566 [Closterium sp. NIES-68]GJP66364.1 hypothetical protein CLOP_g23298 [Closterium sp. NIES-67]GJP70960.1 hypothetical protein CLOP_g1853 [Closterium sp. NIES-67]